MRGLGLGPGSLGLGLGSGPPGPAQGLQAMVQGLGLGSEQWKVLSCSSGRCLQGQGHGETQKKRGGAGSAGEGWQLGCIASSLSACLPAGWGLPAPQSLPNTNTTPFRCCLDTDRPPCPLRLPACLHCRPALHRCRPCPTPLHMLCPTPLQALPYTAACFKEALRLSPPGTLATRLTKAPAAIQGMLIPAGSDVHVSVYGIQRSERYWVRPLDFLPDRWLPGAPEAAGLKPEAWLPFGDGARK